MGKKTQGKTLALPEAGGLPPTLQSILESESSLTEKRRRLLEELGVKKTKKKYPTAAARKEAAKARAAVRREEKKSIYAKYGLEPKPKGPKVSDAERKARRKTKGASKRSFLKEMAKANPDLAKKYGIDVSRFKI